MCFGCSKGFGTDAVVNFLFALRVEVRPRAEEVINMPQKVEIVDISI